MMYRPFTPHRDAFIRNLRRIADEDLRELFYCCLRWINYFQDEDNRYTYLKIFTDVHMEVKRRQLPYTWTNKDIKKYRILAQRMYYGALSYRELEWKLGGIILYSIPMHRYIVKDKMYLIRESVQIIIDCIHDLGAWSELEYNRDVIATLDQPFFSYENFVAMYRTLKAFWCCTVTFLIFLLFVAETVLRSFNFVLPVVDPEYGSWKNMLKSFIFIILLGLYKDEILQYLQEQYQLM